MKTLNLSITMRETPNAKDATKTDVTHEFLRVDAATSEVECRLIAAHFGLAGANLAAFLAAVDTMNQGTIKRAAGNPHLVPPTIAPNGDLVWTGLSYADAQRIQSHAVRSLAQEYDALEKLAAQHPAMAAPKA